MDNIINMIILYATLYGVDPAVALSVADLESNMNPKAVGALGEVGLYQLRPEFFKTVKRKRLFNPETNIKLGIKHLAKSSRECKHKKDYTYVVCYNMGVAGAERVKYPKKFRYYKLIHKRYGKWVDQYRVLKNLELEP